MDSKNGGHSSSDLQRQAASALARKKVLAAYAASAKKAAKEASKNKPHESHMKITKNIIVNIIQKRPEHILKRKN